MSNTASRGDGVGIEIADSVVRGVRLRHDVEGRVSAAAEFAMSLGDDNSILDALVLLHAELADPDEPARIATFPPATMLQRVDITGRSGPQLNELRFTLDRRHGIKSTVVVDDGPRRWLLLIRWDAPAVRRLEALAERAGFIDVTIEPSPLALARVTGPDASFVRRLVAQGDAHRMVVHNRLPVAAIGTREPGRAHPDLDISTIDVTMAYFEDFMNDAAVGEVVDRIDERAATQARTDRSSNGGRSTPQLDVAGTPYPPYPLHDQRSAQRQAVALGAAVGAAGLAGPLRPVDMIISSVEVDDQFDRPWAVEELSTLPDQEPEAGVGRIRRLTRPFRSRTRR